MRILIIAATEHEIQPFLESALHESPAIDILITGVGMVATAYSVSRLLASNRYDLLLNVGIAGTFHKETPLGSVYRVSEDLFSELGAENEDRFLTLKEIGFGEVQFHEQVPLFSISALKDLIESLPTATGITVNSVHGKESSIQTVVDKFSPDIESMEGAAVFYVASQENIPVLQIRSISNVVEKRNKDNWNIPLAIHTLNHWLIQFTTEFLKVNLL